MQLGGMASCTTTSSSKSSNVSMPLGSHSTAATAQEIRVESDARYSRINVSKKLQNGLGFTCAAQAALAAAAVSHSTVSAPSKLHFPLQGNSQRSHNQADRKIKKSETCCSRNGFLLVSSKQAYTSLSIIIKLYSHGNAREAELRVRHLLAAKLCPISMKIMFQLGKVPTCRSHR